MDVHYANEECNIDTINKDLPTTGEPTNKKNPFNFLKNVCLHINTVHIY